MTNPSNRPEPSEPAPPDWLTAIRDRVQAAADDPFFVTDCEGDLSIWRQSALAHVTRNDEGEITGWSTPSSYKVTDHIAEIELDTWDPGEDPLDDRRRTDIHDMVIARDQDRPRLLAHIDQLEARLAAAEAAFPGITYLTPGEPVLVYRAEHYSDLLTFGLYTNREAARAHGEDMDRRDRTQSRSTKIRTWVPESGDKDAVEELVVFGPDEEDEDATGYLVTPLTVTAVYDPEAEE
ncbi:hypothetical protein AB0H07_39055 [Streptomyces sp. NPDC021354]|uniref:hypothetical protein n=1 Tax=Streptomyces sp. NPDC021354 TaxID=3154793 RepID=UPI00340B5CE2